MIILPPPKKVYIFGTEDDDDLVGTALDEIIYAYDGQDHLNGGGGKDTLYGGKGDDYYYIHDTYDKVVEYAGEGYDWVFSYVTSYTLTDNVERLELAGGQSLYGTGNGGDNWLSGNDQNNILSALGGKDHLDGGKGADLMIGGLGDDYYVVDNTSDAIWEFEGEGKDVVTASANFTLSAHIENLYLQDGAGAINGTGNDLDNYIVGNGSNNILKGMDGDDVFSGNGGADKMYGGIGNDYYIVNSSDDQIFEYDGEGTDDFIWSSATYIMPGYVERMLLDEAGGAINGFGNHGDNVIMGNQSANTIGGLWGDDNLFGFGGADKLVGDKGKDLLVGGTENDTFKFGINFGHDTVADFKAGGDADILEFNTFLFSDFNDVLAHLTQNGADAVITLDADNSVTLQNVNAASLQASDFNFV
jgi:Ca2+-binding RTX toxin-like protein